MAESLKTDLELLKGTLDIHMHTMPCPFPRPWSDVEAAEFLRDAGMRGYVIKDHHGPTVARAMHTRAQVPEVETYGMVCLNLPVGGLNPYAVEVQIGYGAKIVWMPTVNSQRHLEFMGGPSFHGYPQGTQLPIKTLTVIDENGKLREEMHPILKLIAEADVAIQTGHLSLPEQRALIEAALDAGVKKIIVTHANFTMTRMPLDMQIELTRRGVFMEYCFWMGRWHCQDPSETAEWIRAVGPEHVIMSTDGGNYWAPNPAEHMRLFIANILMEGVDPKDIAQMTRINPAIVLGLDPEPGSRIWTGAGTESAPPD